MPRLCGSRTVGNNCKIWRNDPETLTKLFCSVLLVVSSCYAAFEVPGPSRGFAGATAGFLDGVSEEPGRRARAKRERFVEPSCRQLFLGANVFDTNQFQTIS